MRKLYVNKEIELLAVEYSKNLFNSRSAAFELPIKRLENLKSKLGPIKHKAYRTYITKIIDEYEDLLKAKPSEMLTKISEFNTILSSVQLQQNVRNKKFKFYECIVHALRYEDVRETEFFDCLKGLKIKICVYCHAQLAIVAQTDRYDIKTQKYKADKRARLELDHFHPKLRHPFLATSFFNLYPVCGNCNRSKSYKEIKFELYCENNDLDIFNFWLDDSSVINYWLTNNSDDLKINFDNLNGDYLLRNNYDKIFHISGIYNTQKDIVEELLHKAKVYNKSFKEDLMDEFKTLFVDPDFLDRIILGNYSLTEEVHKRPMAKFTQDIARQIGLII